MTKDEESTILNNVAALVRDGRVFIIMPTEAGDAEPQRVAPEFAPIFARAALRALGTPSETPVEGSA